MDNIQKSILAVLGVAALITIIIPDSASEAPKPAATPKVAEAAPPPPPPPPVQDEDPNGEFASQNSELEGPDEYESFGQPMNNATPLGVSENRGGWGEGPQPSQSRSAANNAPPPAATVSNGSGAPAGAVDAGAR